MLKHLFNKCAGCGVMLDEPEFGGAIYTEILLREIMPPGTAKLIICDTCFKQDAQTDV